MEDAERDGPVVEVAVDRVVLRFELAGVEFPLVAESEAPHIVEAFIGLEFQSV